MPVPDGIQQRLVGDDPTGEQVEIETSGRVIRPALAPLDVLVDEAKVRFDADGIHVRAVDPANVGMVETRVHQRAFEEYQVSGELTVGINVDRFVARLRDARKGKSTDDAVQLDIAEQRIVAEVEREYATTTARFASELLTIDPDSVRQEPDIPDLDLSYRGRLDASAFADIADHINRVADHARLELRDGSLVVSGSGDDGVGDVGVEVSQFGDLPEDADGSIFSLDYFRDMAHAAVESLADEVVLQFGDEFPMKMHFQRTDEDGEPLVEHTFMLAPRIEQ
jgi:proliferating cell nuclear antigen